MSRIIAGLAGSIRLKAGAKATRPTSDRVKESLFAKLESMGVIEGARVLDLYAGTGALGLEAASRGAVQVVLVESDKVAVDVISANIALAAKSIGSASEIDLQHGDVRRFLLAEKAQADLVFVDPPYELGNQSVEELLGLLHPLLRPEAIVVIERSSRGTKLDIDALWEELEMKTYGDTALYFLCAARN